MLHGSLLSVFLTVSLFLYFVLFFLLSSFSLLYELSSSFSSYFILVHLDNFWSYQALIFWFFIMNGDFQDLPYCSRVHPDNFQSYQALLSWFFIKNRDFWGFSYCSGLSFYIKYGGARQVTFINVEIFVESSETFKKLPWRSLTSLGFTLVARTRLGHDLGVWLGRVLGLINGSRSCVHYKNGLVSIGFISIV